VTSATDFLPTICKLAGVAVPENVQPDGEDVSDIWLGASRPRKTSLHWEWLFNVQGQDDGYVPPMLAVREGDWKLFTSHTGNKAELYNIPQDAGEQHDVAKDNPEVVKSLKAKALAWVKTLPASAARDQVIQTGLPQERARSPKGNAASAKPGTDRKAIFKQKDTDKDGLLTQAEYLHKFPDQAEGKRRFPTFDTNSDGTLTEEEFVKAGKM
jgi:hypothetical protein